MTHLGSFGAAVRELDPDADKDTFTFFDHEFTVHGTMPALLQWQLASVLAGNGSMTSLRAALWSALMAALAKPGAGGDPEDASQFDRFYALALERKADEQCLSDLVYKLFEVQAARPTVEPQGSSSGESATPQSSNGSSPSPPGMRPVSDLMGG